MRQSHGTTDLSQQGPTLVTVLQKSVNPCASMSKCTQNMLQRERHLSSRWELEVGALAAKIQQPPSSVRSNALECIQEFQALSSLVQPSRAGRADKQRMSAIQVLHAQKQDCP